ncbi:MAG: hypothetical protein ABFC89_10600 [Methanospirillum sp.]
MNRTLLLIAIAAIAIVGIGVGLLLPGLQGGLLTGSIVPMTTIPPMTNKLTPTPVPPVVITVAGSYSPYRKWNDNVGAYDWYWNLQSVNTYDATRLPAGVVVQKAAWTITGTLDDGRTTARVSQYSERWAGFPDYGIPPQELPVTDSYTINDGYTWIGCYGPDLCPSSEWVNRPPFTASCTVTATDGTSYTRSFSLLRT